MSNPFVFFVTTRQAGFTGLVQDDGQILPCDLQPGGPPLTPLPPLTPQPTSLQGGLIIDPQNATTVATATGANTATVRGVTGRVFDTYAHLVAAWGTLWPVMNRALQLVWASTQAGAPVADPVLFYAIMLGAHPILLETAGLVPVATSTLTDVTPANRATGANTLLIAEFSSGSAAPTQAVTNQTNSSFAWIYAPTGEGDFDMSQPMGLQSPGGTTTPSLNNSWAINDNVTLNTLMSVDLVDIRPTFCNYAGSPAGQGMSIYQVNWLSPATGDYATVGPNVVVRECSVTRIVNVYEGNSAADTQAWFSNCIFTAGGGLISGGGSPSIVGGFVDNTAAFFQLAGAVTAPILDGNFIAGQWTDPGHGNTTAPGNAGVYFGAVFIDTTPIVQGPSKCAAAFYGQGIIWGSGEETINVIGSAHFAQLQDTFVATFTAPGLVSGIELNSNNAASSHTNANNPDVIHSNITTTPAHLDAATGVAGFGGNAFNLGGASVSNFA